MWEPLCRSDALQRSHKQGYAKGSPKEIIFLYSEDNLSQGMIYVHVVIYDNQNKVQLLTNAGLIVITYIHGACTVGIFKSVKKTRN